MHKKLLIFFGLLVGATLVSSFLHSDSVLAAGEKYQWTSATTVKASGGKYKGETTYTITNDRKFANQAVELVAPNMNIDVIYGACNDTIGRITIQNPDRKQGLLWMGNQANGGAQTSCGVHQPNEMDMDTTVNIAEQAAPPPPNGGGTDWATKDCNAIADAHEKTKCNAIKSCTVNHGKPAADCEAAWTSCMAPDQSEAAFAACGQQVGSGNTKDAKYTPPPPAEESAQVNCKVSGIGWIVCPVMNFMAKIIDQAYGMVAYLLTTPAISTDTSQPMYQAWSVMRNFANVAFVIAFLIVIYSQISGVGISNYGIKKLLPRIIVAAILVNISYWVCAIAVDLSNILGSSLNGLLEGTKNQLFIKDKTFLNSGGGGVWDGITVGIIGATAAVAVIYIGLSVLLPVLIMALLAIVTTVLVLTLRQALIILLVVISPLAFVAYLLPNTEDWFKKWRKLFQTLLLMFPIIAVIFGASSLASTIIMTSAGDNVVLQVMGAAITILPLILVPTFLKGIGGVLGRFGAVINNPNKGPFDRMKKRAEGYRGYRQNVRQGNALSGKTRFGAGQFKRQQRRDFRNQAADAAAKSGQAQFGVSDKKSAEYVASATQSQAASNAINAANNARLVQAMATNPGYVSDSMGGASGDDQVKKALLAQQERAMAEAIKDVELTADIAPGDINEMGTRLAAAINKGDSITARAMQNMMLRSGSAGTEAYRSTMKGVTKADMAPNTASGAAVSDLKRNLLNNHSGVKETAADLVKNAADAGATMSETSAKAETWSMSNEELVKQKAHSLSEAKDASGISKQQATEIRDDEQLYRKLDPKGRKIIDSIAGPKPTPPPPTP